MIEKLERSHGNVYGMKVAGKVDVAQFRALEPEMEELYKKFDKLSFVIVMEEMKGYGLKELAEDIRWAIKHWKDIERVALVGGPEWYKIGAKVDNFFAPWEEKYFEAGEIDAAWEWAEGK